MQIGPQCSFYTTDGRHGNEFKNLFKRFLAMSPDTKVYTIDLKSYGNTVFDGRVIKMAGFSDKLFEIVELLEQDKNAFLIRC